MRIEKVYRQSCLYKLVSVLFSDGGGIFLCESVVGNFLAKIYLPYVAEALLLLSIIVFWYQGLFSSYVPFFSKGYLASVLLVGAVVFAKKENISLGKVHLWYAVFLVLSLVSVLLATTKGFDGVLLISGWFLFAQLGIALVVGQSIKSRQVFLKVLSFLSVPLSIAGIYQAVFHVQTSGLWVSSFEKNISTRSFAFFGSPNVLGILLAVLAFVSLGLFLKGKKRVYLLIMLLDVMTVFLTFSRSAWLGLLAGIVFLFLWYKPKYLFAVPLTFFLLFITQVRERLFIAFSPKYLVDSTLDGRVWAMINGFHIFKKHLFLGTGPGSYGGELAAQAASPVYLESIQKGYTALYFTDNQFLEILVQTGLLGILSFLGFLAAVFVRLIRVFRERRDIMVLTAGASFICFLVSGIFANVLEFGAIVVPMGVILGVSINED